MIDSYEERNIPNSSIQCMTTEGMVAAHDSKNIESIKFNVQSTLKAQGVTSRVIS